MDHKRAPDQPTIAVREDSLAWAGSREEAGRLTHEAFKEHLRMEMRSADHSWVACPHPSPPNPCYHGDRGPAGCHQPGGGCLKPKDRHHSHMVDWWALTPEARDGYCRQARPGFLLGYAAGRSDTLERLHRVGLIPERALAALFGDATMTVDVTDHVFVPRPDGAAPSGVRPVCWHIDRYSGGGGLMCGRPADEHALEGVVGG